MSRLIDLLSQTYVIDGLDVAIGASMGIALFPDDGQSADDLLKNADMALYQAKSEGRGRHRFFQKDMDLKAQERRAMEADLKNALAAGQLEVHYQPLVDISGNRVSGFEALLRWRHPTRGMIAPSDFIPIAEATGLIIPIGEWVLKTACAEAATWRDEMTVAVNLSAIQFRAPHLVNTVIGALAHSGLAPERLELEITETVLLAETETTLATLHKLRDFGVRIALDDFGTGYSSLSYLRGFPFDKIKIDRSFVKDLSDRVDCTAIISAISGLAKSLGIATTAEGVETREQLDFLSCRAARRRRASCSARPCPAPTSPNSSARSIARRTWPPERGASARGALTAPFAVEMRHRQRGIALALRGAPGDRRFDRGEVGRGELQRRGGRRLRPLAAPARADQRQNVGALRQNPRDGDRRDARSARLREGAQRFDQREVVIEVLAGEARGGAAPSRACSSRAFDQWPEMSPRPSTA